MELIAKTFQGLEPILAQELKAIGANDIELGRRMVAFTGDKATLYKANFCLRTAIRVLKPISVFKADDADKVYEEAKKIDWQEYMDVNTTFLVDAVVFSDNFRHSQFAAYRMKDAIADYWREKTGDRPNVSISNPGIRINLHISNEDVTVSLDSSGESLHLRGYKVKNTEAPINEVLAAGLIMLSGWDRQSDFIDPFCGSGTILIEAALMARNIYPGVYRKEYAFEKWKDYDADLFERIYNDDSAEREFPHKLYGYDINSQVVKIAQDNVKSAGVSNIVEIQQRDIADFKQPADKAIIITNPPYGERIGAVKGGNLDELYATIGERLKHAFVGGEAWIISNREEFFANIGMRPSTKFALLNGNIECEFRKYQVFDGKLKQQREKGVDIKSAEERKRNAKYKPHKKNEDGSWTRENTEEQEDHYFKAKPFKDGYRKDKSPREDKDERGGSRGQRDERISRSSRDERGLRDGHPQRLSAYEQRRRMYEAMDDEEAEIIKKHIRKWEK